MAFLGGIFGGGGGTQNNAAMMGALAQQQAAQQANAAVQNAANQAVDQYKTNYYDPYSQTGGQANTMYSNALGLNGPQGNQTA
jgi:hypothetical protein